MRVEFDAGVRVQKQRGATPKRKFALSSGIARGGDVELKYFRSTPDRLWSKVVGASLCLWCTFFRVVFRVGFSGQFRVVGCAWCTSFLRAQVCRRQWWWMRLIALLSLSRRA